MKCPIDDTNLVMSNRQGIEIDYCPDCRGVWLDRGELDKIIERSEGVAGGPATDRGHERGERYPDDRPYKKRRESWLSELFD